MRQTILITILSVYSLNLVWASTPKTTTAAASALPYKYGMVVSESEIASEIGADILDKGGNAIDAAVAVGYALAVVNPCCGNIGGGGFMTIHLANGKDIFLNFRETAPAKVNPEIYKRNRAHSTMGFLAVGVPGTVLGLETALNRYGTMSRREVMKPAIQLAEHGFVVTPYMEQQLQEQAEEFANQPNVKQIFFRNGKPYKSGELLVQKNLAATLRLIAEKGPDVFYKGKIAQEIVLASKTHNGFLTLEDFAQYKVEEKNPITCNYRGYQIVSAALPSSGGITLCEALNILENFPLNRTDRDSLTTTRTIIEAMRYSFIDRNTKLGDPNFVANPVAKLLSKDYAHEISKRIRASNRSPVTAEPKFHPEMTDTTHYSVLDKNGNAVAVTYTINGFFGANVIAGNTGFFLNNEMDDFSIDDFKPNKFGLIHSKANIIEPGKQPLSSMSPTIVLKNNQVFMVLGSPGGPRIITSVLLTLLNVIDFGEPLKKAINSPRFHYQANPDVVDAEPFSPPFLLRHTLEQLGYHVLTQPTWGAVEAILVKPGSKSPVGANDKRRPDGAAIRAQ